mmetsp:Transcript_49108/g.117010  ORF Transcript_49108/g.117010 Transcript_49108/m.117010 type:complete len:87 (-) Transcript_49108:31-291(-)
MVNAGTSADAPSARAGGTQSARPTAPAPAPAAKAREALLLTKAAPESKHLSFSDLTAICVAAVCILIMVLRGVLPDNRQNCEARAL